MERKKLKIFKGKRKGPLCCKMVSGSEWDDLVIAQGLEHYHDILDSGTKFWP